jgi:hypothetical protein
MLDIYGRVDVVDGDLDRIELGASYIPNISRIYL